MLKQRHTPIRTCVACRATDEKRDLLRVVRQPDGAVRHDPKGKLSGRGAYVCANLRCITQARKQRKLERSLKVSAISDELFEELNARAVVTAPADGPEVASGKPEGVASGRSESETDDPARAMPPTGQESEAD